MTKSRAYLIGLFLLVLISLICIWLSYGLWQTHQALQALQDFKFQTSAQAATRALPVATSMNAASFYQIPDVRLWQESLELLQQAPDIVQDIKATATADENQTPNWMAMAQKLKQLQTDLGQSWVMSQVFPEQSQILTRALTQFDSIYQAVLTGDKTFLVIFQNGHELRATGGFMGSYATVKLHNGQVTSINVQDIYVPDGQFTGFIAAPAGVEEYLSSGHGLRLPDANWSPDFPSSAQDILSYFALGDESQINGVIAVNLELAESVLDIFGEVFVPDYQMTINSSNVATALRTGRDGFFPGSIQKQHLLGSVVNQLKFRLSEASPEQQQQLLSLLQSAVVQKELQAYAHDQELEKVFTDLGAGGQLQPSGSFYFFPVESNVGINKANPGVSRQIKLDIEDTATTATLSFMNNNSPAPSLATPSANPHYANYQRIFLKPETAVLAITIDGQTLSQWDESVETTTAGEQVKQIGFLLTVPAQTTREIILHFQHPPLGDQPSVGLQKQSGVPPIPYEINMGTDLWQFELDRDSVLQF